MKSSDDIETFDTAEIKPEQSLSEYEQLTLKLLAKIEKNTRKV